MFFLSWMRMVVKLKTGIIRIAPTMGIECVLQTRFGATGHVVLHRFL